MRTAENIYKRKDGYWEGRYKNGYKENGKVSYKSVYAKKYAECKERRNELENKASLPPDKKKITIDDLFNMYIVHIRKESTLSTYHNLYYNHIGKAFGGLSVCRLTKSMIEVFLIEKLNQYSENYVISIKTLLFSMLNFAVNESIIHEKIKKTVKIKTPVSSVEVLTVDEQQRLENYIMQHTNLITAGILLVLYTGIRIGELCALNISHLDLTEQFLYVRKTMQRIKNLDSGATSKTKIIVDTPKSQKAVRNIPLPQFLIDMLKTTLKTYHKNSYILTGSLNKFIEPRTMENHFKAVLKRCQIENKNFHALRHTFATNCVINGFYDIKTLSEILGHEDVKTTLNRYVHSCNSIKAKQVERLHNAFVNRVNYGMINM